MGNFRPNNRGFDRGNRSSGSRFGGRSGGFNRGGGGNRGGFGRDRDFDRAPVQMHDAVCDKCEKECQVPFRPSEGKPVLCSDCFRQKDNNRNFGSRDSNQFNSGSPGVSQKQIDQINAKLDKILSVLEDLEVVQDDEDSEEDDAEK